MTTPHLICQGRLPNSEVMLIDIWFKDYEAFICRFILIKLLNCTTTNNVSSPPTPGILNEFHAQHTANRLAAPFATRPPTFAIQLRRAGRSIHPP